MSVVVPLNVYETSTFRHRTKVPAYYPRADGRTVCHDAPPHCPAFGHSAELPALVLLRFLRIGNDWSMTRNHAAGQKVREYF